MDIRKGEKMLRKKEDKLNIEKLNEGLKIGVNVLRILWFMLLVAAVYLATLLLAKWQVIPFVIDILKVISPLFIGIAVAWLFDPFVTRLKKKGVNRILGSVFAYILLIIFLVVLGATTFPSITKQINDIVAATPSFITYLKDGLDGICENISNMSGYDLTDIQLQIYDAINNLGMSLTVDLPNMIVGILSSIVSGGINFIFGLIIGFYMLFDFGNIRKHFLSLVPKKHKEEVEELLDRLNVNLKNYVHGTLLIMVILFTFQSIGLTLAGMKAPLVFGLFCAITNVIPYLGPYIGGIPTVLVGFSINPMVGFLTLASVVIAQILESYFLQPIVMGKSMSLHPVTIMIGLLLFGHFFGILGMILATPVIAICKTILLYYNEKYALLEKIKSE